MFTDYRSLITVSRLPALVIIAQLLHLQELPAAWLAGLQGVAGRRRGGEEGDLNDQGGGQGDQQ
jgi:hypothetical protein